MSNKTKNIAILTLLACFVLALVATKLYFGHKIAKKHMPSITFWEYYWSMAK